MNYLMKFILGLSTISFESIGSGFTYPDFANSNAFTIFSQTSFITPIITKITANQIGKQTTYDPSLFEGYFIGDTEFENILTIEGSGFGLEGRADTRGRIILNATPNYYIITIKSWTDNKIEIKYGVHTNATPKATSITLITSGKNPQSVRFPFKIAPAVNGEQYGECTWWTGKRRKEEKRPIPKPAFTDPNFKEIDEDYMPQAKDIWKWGLDHQAFVEFVKVKIDTRGKDLYYTFNMDISEANSDHRGTPKICYSTKVEVEYKYNKGSKSYSTKIISGIFGKPNGEKASHYFR